MATLLSKVTGSKSAVDGRSREEDSMWGGSTRFFLGRSTQVKSKARFGNIP